MKIENLKFNNCFAFILGREQKIALAELEAVLRRFDICFDTLSLQDNIAIFKLSETCKLTAGDLLGQLGGTVKIFEIVEEVDRSQPLSKLLVNELSKNNSSGTLNFAISDYTKSYSAHELSQMGIQTKIYARKRRPVRFVASRETELSSATSYHKIFKTGGVEFGIFKNQEQSTQSPKDDGIFLGRLAATSNPDEWSERDYGKPAGDKYSGMMPPKLARAMVNIALGENLKFNIQNLKFNLNDIVVFDPFCGSGNILLEAALLGCDVVGSDISEKAVADTRTNLEWLYNLKFNIQNLKFNLNCKFKIENSVFVADATGADFTNELKSRATEEQKNIVIVTEPYLGRPKKVKVESEKVKAEIEELKQLYLQFFSNLAMKQSDTRIKAICFVFPLIETLDTGSVSLYAECIDDLRKMGYNGERTLRYGRDYQIVKREIALLSFSQ